MLPDRPMKRSCIAMSIQITIRNNQWPIANLYAQARRLLNPKYIDIKPTIIAIEKIPINDANWIFEFTIILIIIKKNSSVSHSRELDIPLCTLSILELSFSMSRRKGTTNSVLGTGIRKEGHQTGGIDGGDKGCRC